MTIRVPETPPLGSFEVVAFRKQWPCHPVSGMIQCPHGERYLFQASADGSTCHLPLGRRCADGSLRVNVESINRNLLVDCGCDVDEVRYEAAFHAQVHKERLERFLGYGKRLEQYNGWEWRSN